jgi:hypothetical protein
MDSAQKPNTFNVEEILDQVRQFAASQHLFVVPATPVTATGSGWLVLLGKENLSAADFCGLALGAGARLLYVQAEVFDAGTDSDLDFRQRDCSCLNRTASGLLAELRREAIHFNGRIRQLELAFAAGGVLHCWAIAADWYQMLMDRASALLPLCHDEP